jgi:hypothetical protein
MESSQIPPGECHSAGDEDHDRGEGEDGKIHGMDTGHQRRVTPVPAERGQRPKVAQERHERRQRVNQVSGQAGQGADARVNVGRPVAAPIASARAP